MEGFDEEEFVGGFHKCSKEDTDISQCNCLSLNEFLDNHGLFQRKRDKHDTRPMTHLEMSGDRGGKLCIPYGPVEDRFTELYAAAVGAVRPQVWAFTELRSPVYHMFVDLDEKTYDCAWAEVDRLLYLQVMQRDMRRFFPGVTDSEATELLRAVVSAPSKARHATGPNGTDYTKIGIHFNFPNLLVTNHEALLIRASAVASLEAKMPFPPAAQVEGGWDAVLDDCVYKHAGLRMLGSCKTQNCSCKRQGKDCENPDCRGGKVTTPIPYLAQIVVDGMGGIDEAESTRVVTDAHHALRLTRVRASPDEVADVRFVRYLGCPAYSGETNGKAGTHTAKGAKGAKRKSGFTDDDSGAKHIGLTGRKPLLELTHVREKTIREILTRLSVHYADIQIKDATWLGNPKRPSLCIRVSGEGSSWCANVQRDHSQNRVYMMISAHGARQRCFSSRPRESTRCCRDFHSELVPLKNHESLILFDGAGKRGAPPMKLGCGRVLLKGPRPEERHPSTKWVTSTNYDDEQRMLCTMLAPHKGLNRSAVGKGLKRPRSGSSTANRIKKAGI